MRFLDSVVLCCVAGVVFGCGGASGPSDPQAQVSGKVTNDGKPVTLDSRVVFFNAEKGLTLTGPIDSLGNYSLTPADPKIGVPAGRYTVTIMPPVAAVVEVSQGSPDYKKMMMTGGGVGAPPKASNAAPDIPDKFRDAKTSKLVFEVKAGANTFDMDLSKL
jgi:hypothetical protein